MSRRRDRVVVVTGGSSGIGRAVAVSLARRGTDLVLAARGAAGLADAARACEKRGARVLTVPTDVADEAAVQRLVQAAVDRFGRIDAWVGAAAVWSYGRFEETPSTVFRQVVDTTLLGQVHGARAVLPVFRAQGTGTLVLVASLYGRLGTPYVAPYVTAKWGLRGFAEVLRQELADDRGIHVALVSPPATDTPIYRHAANYTGHEIRPLRPVASPERVARAVVRMVDRPQREVSVGIAQRSGAWLHDRAPAVYDGLATRAVDVLVLRKRTTVGPHDGNVFASSGRPEPADDGWRARDARQAVVTAVLLGGAVLAVRRVLGRPRG